MKRGSLSICSAFSGALPGDDDSTPLIAALRVMDPASVADTLWAKMLSRGADLTDFSAVAHVINEDISRFSPSALVAVLSAMAEAGYVDPPLLVVVAEELRKPESMAALSSVELTTLTWSLAMLGAGDLEELLGAVARHASRLILDFVPSDLARLLGGLGELRHRNQLLLEKAANRLSVSLIPMVQLTCEDVAKVVFAFARLDAYDRDLFDAAAKEIIRTTQKGVSPQAAAQIAWAYAQVRPQDAPHRVVQDKPLLYIQAEVMRDHVKQAHATTSLQHEELSDSALPPRILINFLLSYANLSHQVAELFSEAGLYLADNIRKCSSQDLVIAAYAYSRVKHSSPKLMQAIGDVAIEVLPQLDDEDLVYLASAGPATQTYHEGLMQHILGRILHATESSPEPTVDATVLLDLARVVASVQHHNPEYYGPTLDQLLLAVNKTYNATDIESMSQHCGATDINGLQK